MLPIALSSLFPFPRFPSAFPLFSFLELWRFGSPWNEAKTKKKKQKKKFGGARTETRIIGIIIMD